jgi:TRAP-type mannitol/chloroaromatic compound transport system substrate-binding protein
MKQLNHAIKLLTSLVVLVSLLALGACGKEQQAAAPEETKVEKQAITWRLAQTWGTGFPIFGDAVI